MISDVAQGGGFQLPLLEFECLLQLHAQAARDAVHVGVVGGDFGDMQDVGVCEFGVAEEGYVAIADRTGRGGEFGRVVEHGCALGAQVGVGVVAFYGFQQVVVFEEAPQTAAVVGDSVLAVVLLAYDQGDQFAIDLAQAGGAAHDGVVEFQVGGESGRGRAVDRHDVVEFAGGWVEGLLVEGQQLALGFLQWRGFDPGHGRCDG